jgi:hypothetical protein
MLKKHYDFFLKKIYLLKETIPLNPPQPREVGVGSKHRTIK